MQEKPGEDFYSVEKAAHLLGRTPERIRQMLRAGELEGEHEGDDPHAPCTLCTEQRGIGLLRTSP
jgi:hypothetical protein